jgi:hypothetical protein
MGGELASVCHLGRLVSVQNSKPQPKAPILTLPTLQILCVRPCIRYILLSLTLNDQREAEAKGEGKGEDMSQDDFIP